MADPGWKRPFEDPIPLPGGRQLVTLGDAARYIQSLPEAEHELEHWKTAVEVLLLIVKHNGPTMMARIGMMKALFPKGNLGVPSEPRRKRAKSYRIIR